MKVQIPNISNKKPTVSGKEESKELHVVLIYFLDSLIEVWQKMKKS